MVCVCFSWACFCGLGVQFGLADVVFGGVAVCLWVVPRSAAYGQDAWLSVYGVIQDSTTWSTCTPAREIWDWLCGMVRSIAWMRECSGGVFGLTKHSNEEVNPNVWISN